MCNRYAPPRPQDIAQRWRPRQAVVDFPSGPVFPRAPGPFLRAARRPGDEATWLHGRPAEAAALVGLAPVEDFDAAALDTPVRGDLFGR